MRTSVLIAISSLALCACNSNAVKPSETVDGTEVTPETSIVESLREPSSTSTGLMLNCTGTQDNQGARGMIVIKGPAKDYAFSAGRIQNGKAIAQLMCTGHLDSGYKPASESPHFDRYTVKKERGCGFDDAFVAHAIVEERAGSFSLIGDCGGGETCSVTYYCREKK